MFLVDSVVCATFMLVGIPTNLAVIWIYTRKNSRLSQNKFPIVFAIVDLVALVYPLPVQQFVASNNDIREFSGHLLVLKILYEFCFGWQLTSYLTTLFMASVDKFFAVMFPFKHRQHGKWFFKICVMLVGMQSDI